MRRAVPTLLALALLVAPALAVTGGAVTSGMPGDANADGVVVVAVVDTGINPYHADFRAPGLASPADLVPGYPSGAEPLVLSLDAPTYAEAREKDTAVFERVERGRLYHVPGTKIVGAFAAGGNAANAAANVLPLIDDDGHGTAAASLAVGNVHGACPECLLVVVEGWQGLEWATSQSWIDVVSNSWGTVANAGVPVSGWGFENDWTQRAAERGQTVVFASGNGNANAFVTPEQTYASNTNGPDWVVNVGAVVHDSDGDRRAILGTGRPVDVVADGYRVPAADVSSLDASTLFSGTSAATPIAAGVMAETLRQVRVDIGDAHVGQRWTGEQWAVANGTTAAGPLADGVLTRAELWDAVYRAAVPTARWVIGVYPPTVPHSGVAWADALTEGYGVVDASVADAAAAHLLGRASLPVRDDVAFFFHVDAFVRDAIWGPWDRDGDGADERYALPDAVLP